MTLRPPTAKRRVLVIGGAGFIGTNLANRLLELGHAVRIVDNLSRPGSEQNLEWLSRLHGVRVEPVVVDIRNRAAVAAALRGMDVVYHFAGQVAVTASLQDPVADFEVNLLGTLNVLEAIRARSAGICLIHASTNKVYGDLADLRLLEGKRRYDPVGYPHDLRGIDERRRLELHSPYGCSKGGADHYVLDYARCYGVPATVFRLSCVYGPHQHGSEEQGWVAHFMRCFNENAPITIYGNGKQVRDLLFVDDLVDALVCAPEHMDKLAGKSFNIGGGSEHSASLVELLALMSDLMRTKPRVRWADWRSGDPRWYVSDPSAFSRSTGWRPRVSIAEGLGKLQTWMVSQQRSLRAVTAAGGVQKGA